MIQDYAAMDLEELSVLAAVFESTNEAFRDLSDAFRSLSRELREGAEALAEFGRSHEAVRIYRQKWKRVPFIGGDHQMDAFSTCSSPKATR